MIETAPRPSLDAKPASIHRTIEVLHEPGDCFEIRALDKPRPRAKKHTAAGYFTDIRAAAHAAAILSDIGAAVYVTCNPVNPALLGRAANRIEDYLEPTTSDADIVRRRWLYLDFDPDRPAKISATDDEQRAAREVAIECEQYLTSLGWPLPVIGTSGNGYALFYRIDLPNDAAATALITATLKAIDQEMRSRCGDAAHVDTAVFNAARIVRLFGTANRKGDSLPDRPHRMSELFDPPDPIKTVSRDLLEQLAGTTAEPQLVNGHTQQPTSSGRPRLDMAGWLTSCGQSFTVHLTGDGRTRYQIKNCVFDQSHNGTSACFLQDADGKPGYKCQHNSCTGRGWQEAKLAIGTPGDRHYDRPITRPVISERLESGTKVKAGDRNNFGEVVADRGRIVSVRFISPEGQSAVRDFPRSELSLANGTPLTGGIGFNSKLLTSAEFDSGNYDQRFLIKNVLVANQQAILGGRQKTLKTTLAVDAAISLGSGTRFLNRFDTVKTRTAILSGESGAYVLRETGRRIAAARDIRLADVDVMWGFELPQFARADHLDGLADMIEANSISCLFIDPAYLCMLAGTEGKNAGNLFDMGPILLGLSEAAKWTDATIVLLHHCRKNSSAEAFTAPELEELSMAGFAEWARQWLLVGRRETYEHGSGMHRLWCNIGGSAGHSGCWAVDINEGTLEDDFSGRTWEVDVKQARDARKEAAERRETQRAHQLEKKEEGNQRRLLDALKQFPGGETAKGLRQASGLNLDNFGTAIRSLMKEGRAEACQVMKAKKTYEGFRPTGK